MGRAVQRYCWLCLVSVQPCTAVCSVYIAVAYELLSREYIFAIVDERIYREIYCRGHSVSCAEMFFNGRLCKSVCLEYTV